MHQGDDDTMNAPGKRNRLFRRKNAPGTNAPGTMETTAHAPCANANARSKPKWNMTSRRSWSPLRLAFALGALALVGLSLLASALPSKAQSWKGSAREAGLSVGGVYNGLSFRCLGNGRAAMVFSGFPARLQLGETYTVGVSVDGVAQLFRAKAAGNADGGFSLVDDGPFSVFADLISQLRKGTSVEISGPGGRYVVPLRGSGKALETFVGGCQG